MFVDRENQGIMNVYCSKLNICHLLAVGPMNICVGLVVCLRRWLQERCERITMEREYIVCCFTAKDLHMIPLVLNHSILQTNTSD